MVSVALPQLARPAEGHGVKNSVVQQQRAVVSRLLNIVEKRDGRFAEALRTSRGRPFLFDDGPMRYLHFDERFVQSAMRLAEPDELALGYTRAMMGFLLFQSKPRHILMVGLGGGSLIKYCYRYLPSTRIIVLEIDAEVIALREQFMIPPDDERLHVIHGDAADYMETSQVSVDVLLLDGFSADGPAAELTSARFYANCRRLVGPHGILVANLPRIDPNFAAHTMRMCDEAGWRICGCQAVDSNNGIVFVHKASGNRLLPRTLRKRARRLDQHLSLELHELATHIHVDLHYAETEEIASDSDRTAANTKLMQISHEIEMLLDTIGMPDEDALAKAVSMLESDHESPSGKLLRAVLKIVSG